MTPKFKNGDLCIVVNSVKPETIGMQVVIDRCLGFYTKHDTVHLAGKVHAIASCDGFAYLCDHEHTTIAYVNGGRTWGCAMEPNLMKVSPDDDAKDKEVESLLHNMENIVNRISVISKSIKPKEVDV